MRRIFRFAAIICGVVAITAFFMVSVRRLDSGQDGKSREQLERALHRSIAVCYATYGAYPESLDEITEKYGVQIDEDRFNVFYSPVAENLPPELVITDRSDSV